MGLFKISTNPFFCLERGNHVGAPWVNKTKSSDIDTALLEVLQIDKVQVQAGDEEAVVGGDEGDRVTGVTGMKVNVICEAVEVILRVQ